MAIVCACVCTEIDVGLQIYQKGGGGVADTGQGQLCIV